MQVSPRSTWQPESLRKLINAAATWRVDRERFKPEPITVTSARRRETAGGYSLVRFGQFAPAEPWKWVIWPTSNRTDDVDGDPTEIRLRNYRKQHSRHIHFGPVTCALRDIQQTYRLLLDVCFDFFFLPDCCTMCRLKIGWWMHISNYDCRQLFTHRCNWYTGTNTRIIIIKYVVHETTVARGHLLNGVLSFCFCSAKKRKRPKWLRFLLTTSLTITK